MKIKLNGIEYQDAQSVRKSVDPALGTFLEEWFNDSGFVIGHTSGSTGKPKEIRLNKEDMRASARITNDFLGITSSSALLLCLSVSYIAGKMMVVRAIEAGAELIVVETSSLPLLAIHQTIDLAALVPMQVEESLNRSCGQFRYIRKMLIGGAPVSSSLECRLEKIATESYITFGMTETVSHVALKRVGREKEYVALGGVSFAVDERGCLIINAPHLQTKEFITNDIVKLNGTDRFEWQGRYDNVINSGGVKFFPETIEAKIESFFSCRFFIGSCPDDRLGQRIVLVIEGNPWAWPDVDTLWKNIHHVLHRYELPKEIFFLTSFRETTSGKVIRDMRGAIPLVPNDGVNNRPLRK